MARKLSDPYVITDQTIRSYLQALVRDLENILDQLEAEVSTKEDIVGGSP